MSGYDRTTRGKTLRRTTGLGFAIFCFREYATAKRHNHTERYMQAHGKRKKRICHHGMKIIILYIMKTAISIPNIIFSQAEELAHQLGITRSELYKRALEEYIKEKDAKEITEKLNIIYNGKKSNIDKILIQAQSKSLDFDKEKW
jgi:hypothetical protein